jgi:hypothetical protein
MAKWVLFIGVPLYVLVAVFVLLYYLRISENQPLVLRFIGRSFLLALLFGVSIPPPPIVAMTVIAVTPQSFFSEGVVDYVYVPFLYSWLFYAIVCVIASGLARTLRSCPMDEHRDT